MLVFIKSSNKADFLILQTSSLMFSSFCISIVCIVLCSVAAVYMHDIEKVLKSKHRNFTEEEVCSASAEVPGSAGVTFELCAGIVDKQCSLIEIAQQEVLEECGYKITTDSLETLFSGRFVSVTFLTPF